MTKEIARNSRNINYLELLLEALSKNKETKSIV